MGATQNISRTIRPIAVKFSQNVANIYYCHKVQHIQLENTTYVLEMVRTETWKLFRDTKQLLW